MMLLFFRWRLSRQAWGAKYEGPNFLGVGKYVPVAKATIW